MTLLDFKLYKRFGPRGSGCCSSSQVGDDNIIVKKRSASTASKKSSCECVHIDGEQKRRTLSVRWGLLVLVPIEDITMIGLAIYSFVNGTPEFWSILSISASITSIIFVQCCCGWVGEAHHLSGSKQSEPNNLTEENEKRFTEENNFTEDFTSGHGGAEISLEMSEHGVE